MSYPAKRPPVHPFLAIFFGILAVSTASVFIRYAQAYAPSLVIAAWRLTLAAMVLTPIVLRRYQPELKSLTRYELGLGLLSGSFLAVHFATWITSLEYTTVASSVVLVSTSPLFVALLAPLFLRERISRFVAAGLVLALGGVTIVSISDTCTWFNAQLTCPPLLKFIAGKAFFGDLLAITGALAGACYMIIGRRLRSRISVVSYIYVVYGMAAVVLVVVMLAAQQPPFGYPPIAFLWFTLLALVPQLLGHSSFNWALGYLSAAFVSLTLLGEPIASTILAYFLLNETPTGLKVFGAILILAGIMLASRSERSG
jgi:drug/metabolite transporter (DMT)-like permease